MPLIRTGRGIIYFAHIPKCAGTAVQIYLDARFGVRRRALLDTGYLTPPEHQRWSRTSPQHMDARTFERLFQGGFVDHAFTCVRHPAHRLRSVYLHQRDVEEKIDPSETFSDWLNFLPQRRRDNPWYLDNHARPMSQMVPDDATVFKVEDGLDRLVAWIDDIMGNQNGPRHIEVSHTLADRMARQNKPISSDGVTLTEIDYSAVAAMDPEDFERFGYPVMPDDHTTQV